MHVQIHSHYLFQDSLSNLVPPLWFGHTQKFCRSQQRCDHYDKSDHSATNASSYSQVPDSLQSGPRLFRLNLQKMSQPNGHKDVENESYV